MIVYFAMGLACMFGGVVLGTVAFVALISAWNALPIHKIDAAISQEATVFDWERDFYND